MVKWIDVQCTNSDVWKGGAGAYNEGSFKATSIQAPWVSVAFLLLTTITS